MLTEVDRKQVRHVKGASLIATAADSVFVGVNDSSTGESYGLYHFSLGDTGMLTLSESPSGPVCPFAQSGALGGELVFRRDGAVHLPLQRSTDGMATAAVGVEGTRSPGDSVTRLMTVRYPGLPAGSRQLSAIAHPTEPWFFWAHTTGIGTFSTAAPLSQTLLGKVSESLALPEATVFGSSASTAAANYDPRTGTSMARR